MNSAKFGGRWASMVLGFCVCGILAQDPAHVHRTAVWGKRADLPRDGWMVWGGPGIGTKAYGTRLKSGSPVEIKVPSAEIAKFGMLAASWSPNGKWILCAADKNSQGYFIKVEGTPDQWQVSPLLGIMADGFVQWYYHSPKQDTAKGIYEIAWIDGTDKKGYAQQVNMSTGSPVFMGEKRKISDVGGTEAFMVSGDLHTTDMGSAPTFFATIPNNGLGTATAVDVWKWLSVSTADRMCASSLPPSGTLFATNVGGSLRGKFGGKVPEDHNGFVLMRSKRITDSRIKIADWVLNPDSGAVSVCFVPEKIKMADGTEYSQRIGSDNKWFGWIFANDEDYVGGFHLSQSGQPNKGGYLVRHTDNTWYEIVPPEVGTYAPAAWFDDLPIKPFGSFSGSGPVQVSFSKPSGALRSEVNKEIVFEATASTSEGTIAGVKYAIENGVVLGEASSAPYQVKWTPTAKGSYTIVVTATTSDGKSASAKTLVTITEPPVLTTIKVSPTGISVLPGSALLLTATGLDQDGYDLNPQPTFTWSVDQGGSVSATGLFTATGALGTTAKISATSGAVTGIAILTIEPPVIKINFQPSTFATPQGWLADAGDIFGDRKNGYEYGWNADNKSNTRLRTQSGDALIQTLNHMDYNGKFKWELKVPNGEYSVIIGAGDLGNTFGTYNVTAEGKTVVAFTPSTSVKYLVDSTIVTVSDGRLSIGNHDLSSGNKICYIVVKAGSAAPETGFRFLSPTGNPTVAAGSNLTIVWVAAADIPDAIPSYSIDDGKSWTAIVDAAIPRSDPLAWGAYVWAVPGELEGKNVKLKLAQYDNGTGAEETVWSGTITVGPTLAARRTRSLQGSRFCIDKQLARSGILRMSIGGDSRWSVSVVDPRGRTVLRRSITGPAAHIIDLSTLGRGWYGVSAISSGGESERITLIVDR